MFKYNFARRFLKTEVDSRCQRQTTKYSFSTKKDKYKSNNYIYNFSRNVFNLRKEKKLPLLRSPQKNNSPTFQVKSYFSKFSKSKPLVRNNNRKIPDYKFNKKIDKIIYKFDLPSLSPNKHTKKFKNEPTSQSFFNRMTNLKKIPPIKPKPTFRSNIKRTNTTNSNTISHQSKLNSFMKIIKKNNSNTKGRRFQTRDSFTRCSIHSNLMKSPIKTYSFKSSPFKSVSVKKSPKPKSEDRNLQILEFMTMFYENFVDVYNVYPNKEKFKEYIINFNKTFFYLFDIKIFPKTKICEVFLRTYKYCCVFIVCLIFVSKDSSLITNTAGFKNMFGVFLHEAINIFPYKMFDSVKVNNFMKKYMSKGGDKEIKNILNNLINFVFHDEKNKGDNSPGSNNNNNNPYNTIKNCLSQLMNNIQKENPNDILTKINESILYNYNSQYFIEEYDKPKKKKLKISLNIENNTIDNKEKSKEKTKTKEPKKIPYISKKPEKNYTLVLDLDETLVHNLTLSFGDYFLVRPGVFKFLKNIHEYYEIIIFTAGNRQYANNVIDRIDVNDYISHRLFKSHVIYEDGVPVKKLDLIGRDLNKLIFVDNLQANAKYNSKNFCPISSWYSDLNDVEISKLETKLINIIKSGKYEDDITKGLTEEK